MPHAKFFGQLIIRQFSRGQKRCYSLNRRFDSHRVQLSSIRNQRTHEDYLTRAGVAQLVLSLPEASAIQASPFLLVSESKIEFRR